MSTAIVNDQIVSLAWTKLTGVPTTLAGYGITDPIVLTSGSYADPAWITSLAASKLTGTTLPAAIVTSSLTTVGVLNSGSINTGFGAINIGTDALTAGAITGSGLLTMTGFGAHTFNAGGVGNNSVNVSNTTAGVANAARFTLTTDEGIAGILAARSSTYATSGYAIASGTDFESVRAGGLSLAATNAAGVVRLFAGSNTGLVLTAAARGLLIGVATLPTTGTDVLVFPDAVTLPATMASNTAGTYAKDVGGTVEQYAINEAGERARLTGVIARNSAQFDKTNTTLSDITGLARNVLASTVYRFEAVLYITASAAGGAKFAIAGTATATAVTYFITYLDETTSAYVIVAKQTALGGSSGQNGATSGVCIIRGTINVNAGGTLTCQFAQNVASGTSSVLVNSTFRLQQVP